MTEKRFKLYEHKDKDYILDNPHEHLDFIEMLGDALTSEEIVDLLNELNDENKELKQLIKKTLETTPIEHSLAIDLKNSIKEMYE